LTATTPAITATSEAGTTGATRLSPSTSASDRAPTASVGPFVLPSSVTTCHALAKKSPLPFSIPNGDGTCPMMIVSARPTMNPFSTGSEMKFARKPSRASPATSATAPVAIASAVVIAVNAPLPGATNCATVDADSAAVADIGPTTTWRELPNAA
jgi:hypothetical protein